jgi:cell division protein FtsZ
MHNRRSTIEYHDLSDSDIAKLGPRIAVAGVGGGGNNTVNRLSNINTKGAGLFAFNTDRKHLCMLNSNVNKLILGPSITHGLGAGRFPEIGEKAALLSKDEIERMLDGVDLLFLTAGMGGGTGTGAAPVIAEIGRKGSAVIVGVVTLPFSIERIRLDVARAGIDKLRSQVDTLIIIDNQRLVSLYPNLSLEQAFMLADEITTKAVRGISEAITQPSMINLDFADVRNIMTSGGISVISVGTGSGYDKVEAVVKATHRNKLFDIDYSGATGALFHITGGPDLTLGDANRIGEKLTESVPQSSSVTWGARMDESYAGLVEVIAIFTEIRSQFNAANGKRLEPDSGLDII